MPTRFSTLDWSLNLPTPVQELQIRTFTPAQYSKAKARDARLATANRKRTATDLPQRHCNCCTWQTRADLRMVMLGATKHADSGTHLQERAADPVNERRQGMQDGTLSEGVGRTFADRSYTEESLQRAFRIAPVPQDSMARLAITRSDKDVPKSGLGTLQKPRRPAKTVTIKVKSLLSAKSERARMTVINSKDSQRAQTPEVQAPIKTSSRGRVQRPRKRHKNDLY